MRSLITIFLCMLLISSCKQQKTSSYNEAASVLRLSTIDFDPLEGQLISSGIDTVEQHMFTVYGNVIAVSHARYHSESSYPPGSILSKITWKQQPDPAWFGAKIPSSVAAVEVVRFITGSDGIVHPAYRYYSGDGSGADAVLSPAETDERIRSICTVRASVMP